MPREKICTKMLREVRYSFVYEGITSWPNSNVVNGYTNEFFYSFDILTCSIWQFRVLSDGGNIALPPRYNFIFHLNIQKIAISPREPYIKLANSELYGERAVSRDHISISEFLVQNSIKIYNNNYLLPMTISDIRDCHLSAYGVLRE